MLLTLLLKFFRYEILLSTVTYVSCLPASGRIILERACGIFCRLSHFTSISMCAQYAINRVPTPNQLHLCLPAFDVVACALMEL